MPLLPAPTNETKLFSEVDQIANCANVLAGMMQRTSSWIQKMPAAELLPLLNSNVEFMGTLLTAQENLGGALNTHLDLVGDPRKNCRVLVGLGRTDVVFNESAGQWELAPV